MPHLLTKSVTAFKYDELSESAKEKALEKMSDINTEDSFWHECTIEDAKTIGAILGIDITNIYFSGFSSQGDGACFEGNYKYKKESVKKIKEYAPKDETLHQIAKDLYLTQKKHSYDIGATIKHSGHYYHKYCTEINVYLRDDQWKRMQKDTDEGIKEALRDFMEWIYRTLEKEYDFQNSREQIEETIRANDYNFTEEGNFPAL